MNTEVLAPNAEPIPNGQPAPQPATAPETPAAGSELSTINSQPSTPFQPSPPSQRRRRRNGRVACLPKDLRRQVNEMLDDGFTYNQVIQNLGEHGKDLDEDHIRSWNAGGYQDYLREQRLRDQCRLRQEHAFDLLARPNPING